MTDNFRSIAMALRPHVGGTYALLEAADDILSILPTLRDETVHPVIKSPDGNATWDWTINRWNYSHEPLVQMVLDNERAMAFLYNNKKISAIKELRNSTACGLLEAKNAVEDQRVTRVVEAEARYQEDNFGPQEPPF